MGNKIKSRGYATLNAMTVSLKALCKGDDDVQIVGSICDNCDHCSVATYDEWHTDQIPRSKHWAKNLRGPIPHVCDAEGLTLLVNEGDPVHAYCDKKMEHIVAKVKGLDGQ